MSLELRKV